MDSQHTSAGIFFILVAMVAISLNDMLIKQLSGGYPLHEIVFIRSAIGISFSMVFVYFEGGLAILRPRRPWLHVLRGLLIVASNMTYFAALAVLPLADATALFFVAPLFITLLSIPILGERVGPWRIGAVSIGFIGVIIMQRPWDGGIGGGAERITLILPVIAALAYALNQIMTRKLGVASKASAMAVYTQGMFLIVSTLFFVFAGDGRFAVGLDNPSLTFLLRAWIWPTGDDVWLFLGLGLTSGLIGYTLSAAYRLTDAATVAPFEYIGLPLAILWGWLLWSDWPLPSTLIGIALIAGSGLFVFFREGVTRRLVARKRRVNRRY